MKILITGAGGFVGSETTKVLMEQGQSVVPFDIMNSGQDIRSVDTLELAVEMYHPERILHLAAIARFAEADVDPIRAIETNVIGTMNVVRVANKYHIPVVYASTGSVYMPISQEPPITEEFKACGNSVYGCTKYQGELYIRNASVPWIVLRYGHLYGKEKRMHGLIGGYLERLQRGVAPIRYGGNQSNDFCYIKDVAQANCKALLAPWDKWNQIYNVGTGEELSATEAGDLIVKLYNEAYPEKAFKGKVDVREGRTVDPQRFVYDISKAERMLGFKAEFSYAAGLKDMFALIKAEKGGTND
jgi:UDP-glucose 4-epimerase